MSNTQSLPGDPYVRATQEWLNTTYGSNNNFGSVPVTGFTGWPTVYGLLRALQLELGISVPVDNFGPTTELYYSQNLLSRQDGMRNNKFAILQGALWCKGYAGVYSSTSEAVLDNQFNAAVESSVKQLKQDAGVSSSSGVVTLNVMKALLSMDTFVCLTSYGGKPEIRAMQQEMNSKYEAYIGLMPCDGIYGRNTNKALIYAIQAEEGLPVNVANGNFGNATTNCCPNLPYTQGQLNYSGQAYPSSSITQFSRLAKFALYVNGFGDGSFSGFIDENIVRAFQAHHAISNTGIVDISTWKSLCISCGDVTRSAIAADCATILDSQKASTLVQNGYQVIGRYLTGEVGWGETAQSKALTANELQVILNAGLRYFCIYQTSARQYEYFNYVKGVQDYNAAFAAASELGIPSNAIIYFAVDFDAMDVHIDLGGPNQNLGIIAYFHGVANANALFGSPYRIGIYGARNVCSRVAAAGYTCSSFVADMSTGFSGNLGFKIPEDWAFDQFYETTIGGLGAGSLAIDKNGYSGRYAGESGVTTPTTYTPFYSQINWNAFHQALEAYCNFRENNEQVRLQIPYYLGGKHTPQELVNLLKNSYLGGRDPINCSPSEVQSALAASASNGIDCSCLTYYVLNEACGGIMQSYFADVLGYSPASLAYGSGISSENQTSLQYSTQITMAKDMRPSDFICFAGGSHILIITHVERDAGGEVAKIRYAHSSGGYGPHYAEILIGDQNKDLDAAEQSWNDIVYTDSIAKGFYEYTSRLNFLVD